MKIFITISVVIVVFWSTVSFGATYSGGTGGPNDPYRIGTAADWQMLMGTSSDWSKQFVLIADVNLAGVTVWPVGNNSIRFTGVFDGTGHIIRNVVMNLPNEEYAGLFGEVGKGGAITNLSIKDVNTVGKLYVGGLAGFNYGTVSNCHSTGSATASASAAVIGGLIGSSFGSTMSNCSSSVNVSGMGATIGGLVGYNRNSTISNCSASGGITDNDPNSYGSYAGGLVGVNRSTISKCFASGNVSSTSSASSSSSILIGGLVGENGGDAISNCYATGNVSGTSPSSFVKFCAGGLIGCNSSGDTNDSYATGQVSFRCSTESGRFVGGLIGLNYTGSVNRCYSTGAVGSGKSAETDRCVGGVTGLNMDGVVLGCFWDIQTSGKTTSSGGRGLTTEQMKTMLIYQNAGWADKGWVINDGLDYPRREWENTGGVPIPAPGPVPPLGSGTDKPYRENR